MTAYLIEHLVQPKTIELIIACNQFKRTIEFELRDCRTQSNAKNNNNNDNTNDNDNDNQTTTTTTTTTIITMIITMLGLEQGKPFRMWELAPRCMQKE